MLYDTVSWAQYGVNICLTDGRQLALVVAVELVELAESVALVVLLLGLLYAYSLLWTLI